MELVGPQEATPTTPIIFVGVPTSNGEGSIISPYTPGTVNAARFCCPSKKTGILLHLYFTILEMQANSTFTMSSEIVIPFLHGLLALRAIARRAKQLQIRRPIRSAFRERIDMINFVPNQIATTSGTLAVLFFEEN